MADEGGPYEDGDSPPSRYRGDYYGVQSGFDGYADRENGDRKREHSSHEPEREQEKSRDKDRGDRDRDRRPRADRERDRDRGDRDREDHRGHDRERRSREYDRDRDRRHRHRSRSNSVGRSRDRSRSQSPSRSRSRDRRSKRASGFDMAPPGATVVPGAMAGQIPGMPQPMPGVFPGMFPFGGAQFGGLANMPAQAMTQQATRHARRVYVGGLPPVANEQVGHLPINCLLNEYPYYYKQGVRAGLCVMGIFFCYMNHIRGCTICGCTKNIFMLKTVRVAIL
jgi:splicing factor U2AF subunit